jgi:transcriptional regulator with XRE-family HTH domain
LSADRALHEVEPREQVGAATGALYEYQYHQAAAEALVLLESADAICIYCEWHDDFVTERNCASCCYAFHQVKTRQKAKGPWDWKEFFGFTRKSKEDKEPKLRSDSIFSHLWDHTKNFGARCGKFVFVTDAGVSTEMSSLLEDAKQCQSAAQLPENSAKIFGSIMTQAKRTFSEITDDVFLNFLKRLEVKEGLGNVRGLNETKILIADLILDASEVDLKMSEAKKIGAQLVAAVRDKSHVTLKPLPANVDELRSKKGLMIQDILGVLSLSVEGYRQLREGGREAVVTLSRLQRLCKRNNVAESLIPDMCTYKVAWAAWWMEQRNLVDELDYVALKSECAEILTAHSSGTLKIDKLAEQAKALAEKYQARLPSSEPLTAEPVMGLMISLAVDAEG